MTADTVLAGPAEPGLRRLPVWVFVVLIVVDLAILQGLGLYLTRDLDTEYGKVSTTAALWRGLTVPIALSTVFAASVVTLLRWWHPVVVEPRRVRRWVWSIPIIMIVALLVGMNYQGLSEKSVGFVALLVLTMALVGISEELWFRGIALTSFRAGRTEGRAALWTALAFGAVHATNLVTEGPTAFIQVLVAATSGYFLYLVRRVSGAIILAMLVHAAWDFSLLSGSVVDDKSYPGGAAMVAALVVMSILLIIRRKHIELPSADVATRRAR